MIKSLFLSTAILALGMMPALAGDIADAGSKAEQLMESGDHAGAMSALDDAREAVWNAAPLTINKAILVASDPQGFGIYDIRDGNQYKSGEPIVIYTEPSGFGYGRDGDIYTINMALDFTIKSSSGEELAAQKDFAKWELRSRVPNKEFMGKLTYTFNGIQPGDYIVETVIRDQNSDKTVTFPTPFKIIE